MVMCMVMCVNGEVEKPGKGPAGEEYTPENQQLDRGIWKILRILGIWRQKESG